MIDPDKILGFDWDDGNRRESIDKHIVSQPEAERVFANTPLLMCDDEARSDIEARYHACRISR